MKAFAALFAALDQTTKTSAKTDAMVAYFQSAPEQDKLWCIALYSGRRPKRAVSTTLLRAWAAECAGIDPWLFEECYPIVGDLAETIALILPAPKTLEDHSLTHWVNVIISLRDADENDKKTVILNAWDRLATTERFLLNKLITGGFRVGVSTKLMTRALARATDQDEAALTHKLMGNWTPQTTSFEALVLRDDPSAVLSKPYPFQLAHPLEGKDELSPVSNWNIEHKWDGIRGQMILRDGQFHLWSRGEDLMTDRFPELRQLADFLPQGTVIDGEILAWKDGAPLSFNALQKRLGRKTVPKDILVNAPVILMAYDLLEHGGKDIRENDLNNRRQILDMIIKNLPDALPIKRSEPLAPKTWAAAAQLRDAARDVGAEGLMLKRLDSPYLAGRKKGNWWKWKVDPLTIDAVMIYAQAGHGRRATLFTDYTFAVWNGSDLVPFTKAYSGLTDAEFSKITQWVKKNTQQRFGPVRQVTPHHVFEIAFEGIQASPRHKSGVALRFPRMLRWRHDKPKEEANTLQDLEHMLALYG